MKKTLLGLILITSNSIFAASHCPDLNGEYTCDNGASETTHKLLINQDGINFDIISNIKLVFSDGSGSALSSETKATADNEKKYDEEHNRGLAFSYELASCNNSSLTVKKLSGVRFGFKEKEITTYRKVDEKNIEITTSQRQGGILTNLPDGPTQSSASSVYICQKIN